MTFQAKETRPSGATRTGSNISGRDTPILPNGSVNPAFAPLTESEWAATNSPEAIAHEAYSRGYTAGLHKGMTDAKAECLTEHGTIANRIETAARRFLAMDAEEAHRKATGAGR